RRHTSSKRDWSSDVCSSDLFQQLIWVVPMFGPAARVADNFGIRLLSEDFLPYLEISRNVWIAVRLPPKAGYQKQQTCVVPKHTPDRKSTRLNSSHVSISYAV